MAAGLTSPTGLRFAEDPIIIDIEVPQNAFSTLSSMRTMSIDIYVGSLRRNIIMEVENGEVYHVDIRSAVQYLLGARTNLLQYATDGTSYPTLTYDIDVKFHSIVDAEQVESTYTYSTSTHISSNKPHAIWGSRTEMERFLGSDSQIQERESIVLSRKPKHGECVFNGQTFVYATLPAENSGYAPVSHSSTLSVTGKTSTIGGMTLWKTSQGNRKEFLFLNRYGVLESISANCLEQIGKTVERETFRLVAAPTYAPTQTVKGIVVNEEPERWKMSSGPVLPEWASWWVEEFLHSNFHWMKLKGKWIPVSIEVEDEHIVKDKSKSDALHIDFTVAIGVLGSTL